MALVQVEEFGCGGWKDSERGEPASREYCRHLEEGDILFFPETPFLMSEEDRQFLLGAQQSGTRLHKNIAYRPKQDKVTGLDASDDTAEQMRAVMRRYSQAVVSFASDFLRPYAKGGWKLDYASFRSIEEQGRQLSTRSRNDLIHVDNFPTRPTNGDLILRIFTNVNPSEGRVWLTGDPFHHMVRDHAAAAGLPRIVSAARSPLSGVKRAGKKLLRSVGVPVIDRPPYDQFMLGFHHYMKENTQFQDSCRKDRWEFPPQSTWLVFTDRVPHAVLSGRFALEQTFIISRDSLVMPEKAPIRVLEEMAGCALSY